MCTGNIVGCKNLDNERLPFARGHSVTGCVVFTISTAKTDKAIYAHPVGHEVSGMAPDLTLNRT